MFEVGSRKRLSGAWYAQGKKMQEYMKRNTLLACRPSMREAGDLPVTILGKHCECIAQKCTHLERLPSLASQSMVKGMLTNFYG